MSPGSGGDLQVLSIGTETDCVSIEQVEKQPDGAREFMVIVCNVDCRGAVSSYINITTTDPIREVIRIPVLANLMGTIVVEPEVIVFGPTLPGKDVAQVVKIYCTENLRFGIVKVSCTVNSVECSVAITEGNVYELKMRIKEDAPAGRVTGQIIIETDCESQPLLTAKVTGYVRSGSQ